MGTTSRQSNGSKAPDHGNGHGMGDTLSQILVIFVTFLLRFVIFSEEMAATHKKLLITESQNGRGWKGPLWVI